MYTVSPRIWAVLRYSLLATGLASGALSAADRWEGWNPTWVQSFLQAPLVGTIAFAIALVLQWVRWRHVAVERASISRRPFSSPLHLIYLCSQMMIAIGVGAALRMLLRGDVPLTIGVFSAGFGLTIFLLVWARILIDAPRRAH
jgi:hypothetical protein